MLTRRRVLLGAGALTLLAMIVGAVLVLTRQPAAPTVTFSSSAGTVTTGPTQYCDLKVTSCENHPDAVASLTVPPGQPLRITVPAEVAGAPWQVVFSYQPPDGARTDARSPVFPPDNQHDYRLELPSTTDRLLTAQVQQYGGGPPTVDANGDPAFPIRASWVLTAR